MENRITQLVNSLGIPLLGIAKPVRPKHFTHYLNWLSSGNHANMVYLEQPGSILKRSDPSLLFENTKSILVFGFPYPHIMNKAIPMTKGLWGKLASYATCKDYHTLIPRKLEDIAKELRTMMGPTFQYRIFTDSAPILERDIANNAGLGWIGKNGCLIEPGIGSFFFIAEIFCNIDLQTTPAFDINHCGSCRRCIEACPTSCIQENHIIDSRRCISYLTIENKGPIPTRLREAIGNNLFGCDICQQVCPWNQKSSKHVPMQEFFQDELPLWIDLSQDLPVNKEDFKARYSEYPVMRAKRTGFLRNAMVVIGNSANPESIPLLENILKNEKEALVRSHAAWALGKIASRWAFELLRHQQRIETDPSVQQEISDALKVL